MWFHWQLVLTSMYCVEMEGSCWCQMDGAKWIVPNGWCQRHAQLGFEHWVLDGSP